MDFSALMEVYNKFNIELEFPDGVNPATNIIDFLESEDRPKTIKASFGGGTPYYLRNKARYAVESNAATPTTNPLRKLWSTPAAYSIPSKRNTTRRYPSGKPSF